MSSNQERPIALLTNDDGINSEFSGQPAHFRRTLTFMLWRQTMNEVGREELFLATKVYTRSG